MNCLCCGKPLHKDEDNGWHKNCIKKFFAVDKLPEIDRKALDQLVNETVNKGYTVPGVQKKLSLHLFSEEETPRLTLLNTPMGYILKPQVAEFEHLPEAEHLAMSMAKIAGIATVPYALLNSKGDIAYITKRIDRIISKDHIGMLAMEDFCQLDLRLTQDKYKGSYERCAKIIQKYSMRKGFDLSELYLRLLFSFVIGNSDMHLKNFSFIESNEGSGMYYLSPAYDLLPVNVIMPQDQEQFALTMNGKKRNIRKKDFLIYAETCAISRVSAVKMIRKIISLRDTFCAMCSDSLLPKYLQERMLALMQERIRTLEAK